MLQRGAAWHTAVLGPSAIPSTHVCTHVALRKLSGTQKVSSQLPQALVASLAPAQKSPQPLPAPSTPGADERGTLCGSANSSELNQRRGRIAKPPEMKPKKKNPSRYSRVTESPGQEPPAGQGPSEAHRELQRGMSRCPQHLSSPGSLSQVPNVPMAGAEPQQDMQPLQGHEGGAGSPSPCPRARDAHGEPERACKCPAAPPPRPALLQSICCQEEVVERQKYCWLPGKLTRPGLGSAGRPRRRLRASTRPGRGCGPSGSDFGN